MKMFVKNKVKACRKRSMNTIKRLRSISSGGSTSSESEVVNHGEIKILVLGASGVGKTTICRKYLGDDAKYIADSEYIFDTSTFVNIDGTVRQYDVDIFDYKGQKSLKEAVEQHDGFLLVYSQDDRSSFIKVIEILYDVTRIKGNKAPIVVVGNKSDKCVSPMNETTMIQHTRVDASALKNEGVEGAFNAVIQQCAIAKDPSKI